MSLTAWRKSSFSGTSGSDCVEVAWRKSSFSEGSGSSCVEVAFPIPPHRSTRDDLAVAVRDSKNATGPMLTVPRASWRRFVEAC
ncbi:DUF397 domain-containing protein [Actinophytocola gossypii]|uniref:DUF397 domain-containing protein n=1 Tax=Actinophytocola gossypii TaxID=2812003 RepID=A0ABT2JE01_9PSEU|nr:DUF397 domain-containing protein [Actinophytocola gossypii]MCT2585978.1 DUF397 domain-containing protein [Actinophytocola gossypii]